MSVAHLHAATTLAPRGPPIGTLGGIWPDVVGGAAKAYVLCPTVPWNVCRWQSAVDPLVGCRWVSERAPNHRTTGQKSGRPHIGTIRSEEHTSELQSLRHLVCRLLLEKKKTRL